jgi:hypothetical protein
MRCSLSLLALSCAVGTLSAQCFTPAGGTVVTLTPTGIFAANDEGLSAPLPLGFTFPMAGASGGPFTHVVVDSNGALYLTSGGPATGTPQFGAGNGLDDLRGNPGDSPRVFPLWCDVEGIAPS